MVTRSAFSAGLMVLWLGPLFAQGKEGTPGNPPIVLIASEIDPKGALVLVQYKTIVLHPASPTSGGGPVYNERSLRKVSLEGVKIFSGRWQTGDGRGGPQIDARQGNTHPDLVTRATTTSVLSEGVQGRRAAVCIPATIADLEDDRRPRLADRKVTVPLPKLPTHQTLH